MTLILASTSPRRQELMSRLGLVFEIYAPNIDESTQVEESADVYVARIAADKARAGSSAYPGALVLAADTVVVLDGQILGKARDRGDAASMLRALSGRTHEVITGFCLRGARDVDQRVSTRVTMRPIPDRELDHYLETDEWRGKAGSYAVQGLGAALVSAVEGSVTNVIGLPLAEVVVSLRSCGVEVDYRRQESV